MKVNDTYPYRTRTGVTSKTTFSFGINLFLFNLFNLLTDGIPN